MANLMSDDYERCGCGNADFEEKTIVAFNRAVRPRPDHMKHEPLQSLEKEIKYVCTACGTVLQK